MKNTLYDKIWADHCIRENEDNSSLIYIDRHLIHEVTSPQAFDGLEIKKRDIIKKLEEKGIGTQVHYIPIFKQPYYKHTYNSKFEGCLTYYKKNLSLPMYVSLKKKDIIYICQSLKTILGKYAK